MSLTIAICGLLVPVIVLIVGVIAKLKPAKNINAVLGYRTKRSRASQENWDKAQELMAKYMIRIGLVLLVISVICCFILKGIESEDVLAGAITALSIVQIIGVILVIPLVEGQLKDEEE